MLVMISLSRKLDIRQENSFRVPLSNSVLLYVIHRSPSSPRLVHSFTGLRLNFLSVKDTIDRSVSDPDSLVNSSVTMVLIYKTPGGLISFDVKRIR